MFKNTLRDFSFFCVKFHSVQQCLNLKHAQEQKVVSYSHSGVFIIFSKPGERRKQLHMPLKKFTKRRARKYLAFIERQRNACSHDDKYYSLNKIQ